MISSFCLHGDGVAMAPAAILKINAESVHRDICWPWHGATGKDTKTEGGPNVVSELCSDETC